MTDSRRIVKISDGKETRGPVVYWMSRDQRVYDNEALMFAQETALNSDCSLEVIFCLSPAFLGASFRQYHFMIEGLKELERTLAGYNIGFRLLMGNPGMEIPAYLNKLRASVLVSDFDPLRIKRQWKETVSQKIDIPFFEVDAHNIVPCRIASPRQEFAAYTIRPKINRLLPEFLTEIPIPKCMNGEFSYSPVDWSAAYEYLGMSSGSLALNIKPGENEALKIMEDFINSGIQRYSLRNDPNQNAQSGLSPYLHFGQISASRVVMNLLNMHGENHLTQEFLDELIVRRELSDNFCYYNENYDNFNGLPEWGQATLQQHLRDEREFIYSTDEFEEANTHDKLWNACQREMKYTGKMHGYMRMYWAKKILEFSETPQKAIETAVYLNDKYSIDGRDPNGYSGILWSVGGLHDRAWPERQVFGKVRYMNYSGCKRKFNIREYIMRF